MSTVSALLARIGTFAAVHPWRVIWGWLAGLVLVAGLAAGFGAGTHDDYEIPGARSELAGRLVQDRFPEQNGADARVVLHRPDGASLDPGDVETLRERLEQLPGVSAVAPARRSEDGATALIAVQYRVQVNDMPGSTGVDGLRSAAAPLEQAGLQVELGGQVPENFTSPGGTAEVIGMLAALAILVLAFGNLVAAGLPIAVALVGLGVGMSAVRLLAGVTDVSTTAPTIATMVGIGVGVDYALLLVTRYAEGLRSGLPVAAAVAAANATAGQSVVFAGSTVLASLLGLRFAGLPIYSSYGYATLLVVTAIMAASVTLVPALCAMAGPRVLGRRARRRLQAGRAVRTSRAITRTHRWARRVGARPLPWALGTLAVLLLLAAPSLDMRTWPQDAGSQPTSNTTRRAYDLIAAQFGPGANGPLVLVADLTVLPADRLEPALSAAAAVPGVHSVTPPLLNPAKDLALVGLEPDTGPQDVATEALINRLRAELPAGVEVGGLTAAYADIARLLDSRLPLVVAFVVALALLLLTAVFRSIVVAVKAALMNLLSVAAAYGVMVAVFQWGWGVGPLGLPHPVPVSSFVPVLMFAVLFGLSMDYEVFLLSRIRELWLATGDARGSVVEGLAGTGRVITSAAAIMVAVFAAFAFDADVIVKMTGVGMASAVLLDATAVRLVLVPSTMALLGRLNWWLPRWLDRLLPRLDVEGRQPSTRVPRPAPEPTPGAGRRLVEARPGGTDRDGLA